LLAFSATSDPDGLTTLQKNPRQETAGGFSLRQRSGEVRLLSREVLRLGQSYPGQSLQNEHPEVFQHGTLSVALRRADPATANVAAGDLPAAERAYGAILKKFPGDTVAKFMLKEYLKACANNQSRLKRWRSNRCTLKSGRQ
jgi:hypothetical protein